jgi:DNA-binding CsgD family transcriptional regulator
VSRLRAKRGFIRTSEIAVIQIQFDRGQLPASLSATERAIAELIAGGLSSEQIAEQRKVSRRTVENQIASIFRKTNTRSRGELVALMMNGNASRPHE